MRFESRLAMTVALLLVAVVRLSPAQVVGPAVPLDDAPGSDKWYAETVISANPLSPTDLLVGARKQIYAPSDATLVSRVAYGISTSAFGVSFASPTGSYGELTPPLCGAFAATADDPMIAVSRVNGRQWIGARRIGGNITGFFLVPKEPLHTTLGAGVPTVILCDISSAWDKGWLTVGRRFGEPAGRETMYAVFRTDFNPCGATDYRNQYLESDYSASSTPGVSWTQANIRPVSDLDPTSNPCERRGTGAAAVVLEPSGRLVVAYRPTPPNPNVPDVDDPRLPPAVLYLDPPNPPPFPGALWQPRQDLNRAYSASSPTLDEAILPVTLQATHGIKPVPNFPGICADPRVGHEGDAWVVFAGRPESAPNDTDVYVARGQPLTPGGPLSFASNSVLRLTDADLGAAGGTHQFMPWIAVDKLGGVNLLFYAVVQTAPVRLKSYYVRLRAFNVPLDPQVDRPYVAELTPAFNPVVEPRISHPSGNEIGDYHMIVAQDCYVYVAYMSTEPTASRPFEHYNVYVRRINICTGDVDDNAFVDAGDAPAFASAYISQSPAADLTQDGTINAWDVATFTEALACQCNPQQP